jgi:cation diffusion facilitator CzcD-associated flavoprotein CzcO
MVAPADARDGVAVKMAALQQKYAEEAAKRLRHDGIQQFVELKDAESGRLRELADDPWVDHSVLNSQDPPVKQGGKYKFVILGAGYGGLLFAVRLIQAGVVDGPDDIRLVDAAGGFGGTWYWNRFPGLRCDIESYCYMPLLEETGYIPRENYATGPELLEHANRIASQWNLEDKALFRASVHTISWDAAPGLWTVQLTQHRGPTEEPVGMQFHSKYVLIASGVLARPQVPRIPGLDSFSGSMFHTARWDYSATGGSPTNWNLAALKDKRVGIIGTGATAIQVIPQLAKCFKELYVLQRTPSAVHWRGLRYTDPGYFSEKVSVGNGWQMERMLNLNSFAENAPNPGQQNLVGDAWTEMPAQSAIIGSPGAIIEPTPDKVAEHIARLHALDLPRGEAARERVDRIVKDDETAAKLKAWYPIWCKRVTFSDDYLDTFNLPNVHLVDTNGKGVSSATSTGLVVEGAHYPLDVLVLSTGYRTPAIGNGSIAVRTKIKILGRDNRSLDDKWLGHGPATLHGVCTNGFPNLFFANHAQTGIGINYVMVLDVVASHVAYIVSEAERTGKSIVEPSTDAEESWSAESMKRAAWFSAMSGCTPGYNTSEGELMTSAQQDVGEMMRRARSAPWGEGITSYRNILRSWQAANYFTRDFEGTV